MDWMWWKRKPAYLALHRWQLRFNHHTIIASSIPIHRKCVNSSRTCIRTSNHLLHSETMGLIVNGGRGASVKPCVHPWRVRKLKLMSWMEKGSGVMSRLPHRLSRFNALLVGIFYMATSNEAQKIKGVNCNMRTLNVLPSAPTLQSP